MLALSYKIPWLLKPIICKILSLIGEYRKSIVLSCVGNKSVLDYNNYCFKKLLLSQKFEELYKSLNIDGIISPVSSLPPFRHGEFAKVNACFFYCSIWNFFDCPTAVIPRVHIVAKEDTENYTDSVHGNDSITRSSRESLRNSEGLPIGIQVTTLSK